MTVDPAQLLLDYLGVRSSSPPEHCDAIIGFGHFDARIARRCGDLWRAGVAPRIIFTGGIGAGSADLAVPEAQAFADVLKESHPEIPERAVMLETRSTNTGENVRFLQVLAKATHWPLANVCLVATPYRQKRVVLTWRKQGVPGRVFNMPPETTLAEEVAMYASKGERFVDHLPGEIDRLTAYAERGWIQHEAVPLNVVEAAERLRRR